MGFSINRFISSVDQNLICNICTGVLDHAVVTMCGHSFCHSCLSMWLSKPETESCPICRSYTSRYEIIPNISIRNIVDSLLVWCENSEKGCKHVLKLETLDAHTSNCDFRDVECVACKDTFRKCELAEHCQVCPAIESEMKTFSPDDSNVPIGMLSRKIAMLEIELNKTRKALEMSKDKAAEMEKELTELRNESTSWSNQNVPEFDEDYNYGYSPSSISQLSSLISKNLLTKPPNIDRNRIFMAIKRSFTYYNNYAGYSADVHMLLATAYASNWFPDHHRWTLERWLEQITYQRFPLRQAVLNSTNNSQ